MFVDLGVGFYFGDFFLTGADKVRILSIHSAHKIHTSIRYGGYYEAYNIRTK